MISSAYIKEWRQKVPWPQNDQYSQENSLIILMMMNMATCSNI
jgi:hypothetical protein